MRYGLFVALFAVLLSGCGIEGFESLADPNPPMSLTAFSRTNAIILRFTSYNYEDNFSGFNVYIGDSKQVVVNKTWIVTNVNTESIPTHKVTSPFLRPSTVEIVLDGRYRNRHPFTLFTSHIFVGVSAYDSIRKLNSITSDVTNLVITNN